MASFLDAIAKGLGDSKSRQASKELEFRRPVERAVPVFTDDLKVPQNSFSEQFEKMEIADVTDKFEEDFAHQQETYKSRESNSTSLIDSFKKLAKKKKSVNVQEKSEELRTLLQNIEIEIDNVMGDIVRYEDKISETDNERVRDKFKSLHKQSNKILRDLQTNQTKIKDELNKLTLVDTQQTITEEVVDVQEASKMLVTEDVISPDDIDDVNIVEVVKSTNEALIEIPDADEFELGDIQIVKTGKKDKTGYFKAKVKITTNNIPEIINQISSYVKVHTKGLIKPRVVDLRVIGNTNKTQLRNSELKLSTRTVVFKPDSKQLRVNKGTRFMLSVPDNFDSTKNLLVYIQESRAKTIMEITPKDFESLNHYIEWIGDKIVQYYYQGYEVTLKRLKLRGTDNPFVDIVTTALRTSAYKAKFNTNSDGAVIGCSFLPKNSELYFLATEIKQTNVPGYFSVNVKNTMNNNEYSVGVQDSTLPWFIKNIVSLLGKIYTRDWKAEIPDFEEDKYYYMALGLKHRKLFNAFTYMVGEFLEEKNDDEGNPVPPENDIALKLHKIIGKNEMQRVQGDDYDAESIVGETKYGVFVLTYYAHEFIGGDKRHGSDYITRQQYYQKYDVRDRRQYEIRRRIKAEESGKVRNYNARKYLFMLKYMINGIEYIHRAKTFDEIMEHTGFLTHHPIGLNE